MTREEAQARARELNLELGREHAATDVSGGGGQVRAFYIEVEQASGEWTVEKRTEEVPERSILQELWSALLRSPGP